MPDVTEGPADIGNAQSTTADAATAQANTVFLFNVAMGRSPFECRVFPGANILRVVQQ
jgi:hypothetical protein